MATRFGRSVGGNWSAAGTWSATTGGGSDGTGIAAGDVVILDANSGSGTFTIDTAISILGIDCTGFTGTLVHNGVTLTISANDAGASPATKSLLFSSGMTYTATTTSRLISMTAASGATSIDTKNKSLGSLTLGLSGTSTATFSLLSDLTIRLDGTLNLTSGTFDAAGFNVTTGLMNSSNSNTRTMTMGSGTWTLNSPTSNAWDYSTITGLTHTPTTAPIILNRSNPNGSVQYNFSSKSYGPLTINAVTTGGYAQSYSMNSVGGSGTTFASITVNGPAFVSWGSTYTVTGAITYNGTDSANLAVFRGAAAGTSMSIGAASTANWAYFDNLILSGAGALTTTNCVSVKSATNSGFTLNGPTGGGSTAKVFGS